MSSISSESPEQQLLEEWLESGEYLPAFLSTHDKQRPIFRSVHQVKENSDALHGPMMADVTMRAAHIYTIDIFLWVMAQHGYTLQKSRRKLPFQSITTLAD